MGSIFDEDLRVWIDGKIVSWRDAKMPLLTHGLNYGGFVFEGIRSYGGHPFLLEDHCVRLRSSCTLTGMNLPCDVEALVSACLETLEANQLADAYLRPFASRGSDQIELFPGDATVHVGVVAWPWPPLFGDEARTQGIPVKMSGFRRPCSTSIPPQAKVSAAYLPAMLARLEAVKDGFVDSVLCDAEGDVADVTAANLFIVADGTLVTPIADRCLSGFTRRTVTRLAYELGIPVVERRLTAEDLFSAEEMFLAGTAYEIQPVSRLDSHTFGRTTVGLRIQRAFEELVRSEPNEKRVLGHCDTEALG
jgi:branched-chain amino acid aminotransferase